MTAVDLSEEGAVPVTDAQPTQKSILTLLVQALLLNGAAYGAVRNDRSPFRRGLLVLLAILGIVGLARLVGLGLGLLTAPQLGSIQQIVHDFLTGLPWYAQQVTLDPQFASQFELGQTAAWDAIRVLLGVPVPLVMGGLYGLFLIATLVNWLVYGVLAHLFARWLGGQASFGQTMGVLALAYAPLLLFVVELVPGAVMPVSLVFALLLVGKFLAISQGHGLSGGYALAAVVAPYLVALVMAAAVALFGGAYGLEQIPYLDQALRTLPMLSSLAGL